MIDDVTPHLHPDLAAAVAARPAVDFGSITDYSQARAIASTPPRPAPDDVAVDDLTVISPGGHQVGVRTYRPADGSHDNTLVWIHGGGFVIGAAHDNDDLGFEAVRSCGANVVSVDWRLAPEHPFPAGVDDCYAALEWVATGPDELGGAQTRIAVGGGSAGGCLAAAVALMARDREGPELCHQLLIVPVLDHRLETWSATTIRDARVWNREKAEITWRHYLGGDGSGEVSPYASPARADDVSGLPPATVLVAEWDLLRDEAVDYAGRLTAAHVHTDLIVYGGTCHGHTGLAPHIPASRRTTRDALDALRSAFGHDE